MYLGLEIHGRRIDRDVVAEPTETWRLIFDDRCIPKFPDTRVAELRDGHPDSPGESVVETDDGNFDDAADENVPVVDHAHIVAEPPTLITFRGRYRQPWIRHLASEVERQLVELLAATVTSPGILHKPLRRRAISSRPWPWRGRLWTW